MLSRARHPSPSLQPEDPQEQEEEETVTLTGSTGNIYTTTIARQPRCDCPHARAGHAPCKHIVYVLARVLRARYDLVYQLALLRGELREVLAGAPLSSSAGGSDGRRKPVDGDCPICFCEMEVDGRKGEEVVWCRAACGQNVHRGCFETWAATKRRQQADGGGEVTCPYCRSVWEGDEEMVMKVRRDGERNAEGYVNVADQLGISGQRGEFNAVEGWRSWGGLLTTRRQTTARTRSGGLATLMGIATGITGGGEIRSFGGFWRVDLGSAVIQGWH